MTKLYDVGYGTSQDQIEDSVKEGLEEISLPDKHGGNTFQFKNVSFKRNEYGGSIHKFKDALLSNKSILSQVYADVYEKPEHGKSKRVATKVRIASMPQMLDTRGTFVVRGSDYNIVNQLRKNPAPYITQVDGADRPVTATFNLSKGRNFAIELEPKTSKFFIVIGSSNILLKSLAVVLGLTRSDMVSAVGEDMTKFNWDKVNDRLLRANLDKLYKKVYEYRSDDPSQFNTEELKMVLKTYFNDTAMDKNTTKMLYNKSFDHVNKEALVTVLREYMEVYKKKKSPADQDDLYYQRVMTPNLLFKDRINKTARNVEKSLSGRLYSARRSGAKPDYSKVFNGIYSNPLVSMVTTSGLARLDPQYNPFGILATPSSMTPLGIGGVGDVMAIRSSQRDVRASSIGIVDPLVSPQGATAGLLMRTTNNFKVDGEGYVHLQTLDKKGKNPKYVPMSKLKDQYVALPNVRPNDKSKNVRAIHNGAIVEVAKKKVDRYFVHGAEDALNEISQLLPMANAVQGNRNFMSTRQVTQSLPLVYKEEPLVQTVSAAGENLYSKVRASMESFMPLRAKLSGTVTSVKDGAISIKGADNKVHKLEYAKHLPLATNTGIHQTPLVHKGDKVKKGQIILKDNYTSKDGKVAFGVNLRTAFMPYRGQNSEDSVVISDRAANKLTSVHYYKYDIASSEPNIIGKKAYLNMYPNKFTPEQLASIDSNGVIRDGVLVKTGDPLILALSKVNPDDMMKTIGRISKDITVTLSDAAVLYEHEAIGSIIESSEKSNVLTLTVKTLEKAIIGDKVAGLYGNKGVVSTILDNAEMPQTPDGDIIDLIYAPSVVPSRMNPGQILEQSLGKIVKLKRKKIYTMEPLSVPKGGLLKFVKDEQKKYKVPDKDVLFDPITKKNLKGKVSNGFMYTMKLLKGDKDFSARGLGPSYSSNKQPTKGGSDGAKAIGQAEFYALAAHGARNIMNDMSTIKGQHNPDYWRQLLYGSPPAPAAGSFAFQRFKASLTSAGAVMDESQDGYQLLPLTDRLTTQLAGHRVVQTPALLSGKTLEPIKKGLYDKGITGGVDGSLWSKIELGDGMISPLVETYVGLLLGMSKAEIRSWQQEHTTKEMKAILSKIDVKAKIKELSKVPADGTKIDNKDLKLLRFLRSINEKGDSLSDLIITEIPVPPPKYRPITQLGDGNVQIADVNHYYKDVMIAKTGVESMKKQKLRAASAIAKGELMKSVHALVGTGQTANRTLINKGTKNIMDSIGGKGSPKQSFIHSNLIKKNQDLAGRARIVPNPQLNMDEVGIPEQMAWKLYSPFIKKRLVQSGITPVNAAKDIARKTTAAKNALVAEIDSRPVLLNRAPTLHRFGFLGAKPKLVSGNSIQIPLEVTKGFNADFDGDAMQIHVPVTPAAVRETERMTLSNNILGDVSVDDVVLGIMPETAIGFYSKSKHDRSGLIKDVRKILPASIKLPPVWDKPGFTSIIRQLVKTPNINIAESIHKLKILGNEYSTVYPTTVGIEDIDAGALTSKRNRLLDKTEKALKKLTPGTEDYARYLENAQKDMMTLSKGVKGGIGDMLRARVKGNDNQVSGMILSPVISYNPNTPLQTASLTKGSYSDGLEFGDFFNQVVKARADGVKTALSVALPGSLSKLLTSAVNRMVITETDCETTHGVSVDPNGKSTSIQGSLLAEKSGKYSRNTVIDAVVEKALKKAGKSVIIRSPQTCEASEGVCAKCYGSDHTGKLVPIGTHVGVRIAQGVSMPLAQMALDSKHGGRSITKDIGQGGLVDISKIFSSNNSKSNMAVIAMDDGVVSDVEELPSGANVITMADGGNYVAGPELDIRVKAGSTVLRGKPITSGIVPFTDVIDSRGIVAGRKALTDQFRETLASNGTVLSNRALDLIGRAAANYVKLYAPVGKLSTGDTVEYSKFKTELKGVSSLKKLSSIEHGMQIADEFGDLSAGTILTEREALMIRSAKTIPGTTKSFIGVVDKIIPIEWVGKTIYTAGLADDDWMHHIGARYIKRNIIEAAAEGKVSKKKTLSPVNVWMQGKKMNTAPNTPYY